MRIFFYLFALFCVNFGFTQTILTENGYTLPVKGELKVLIVFADGLHNPSSSSPNPITAPAVVAGYGEAPLPLDVLDYFDLEYDGDEPDAYISKYLYQSSFGQYIVTADYLDHRVEVSTANDGYAEILNYLRALEGSGALEGRMINGSSLSDFDNFEGANLFDNGRGAIKPNNPNTRIDAFIILWKNHPSYYGGGEALLDRAVNIFPYLGGIRGFDNNAAFDDWGGLSGKQFLIQEYFHAMYGGNHWHTGAGAGRHTFFTYTNPWGIPTQSAGRGVSNVVNGWDRNHLGYRGWKDLNLTIPKDNLISAMDLLNSEVATDISASTPLGSGLYVLRDFVTTGDAIRIKLPHVQDDPAHPTAKNQYLWIENHQQTSVYDVGLWDIYSCHENLNPGLWMAIQVGKDDTYSLSGSSNSLFGANAANPNGLASWMFPLTGNGNYDFVYENPHTPTTFPECAWNGNTIAINQESLNTLENPLTGFSEIYDYYNSNGDDFLNRITDTYPSGLSEIIGGTTVYNGHRAGDSRFAWSTAAGNTKISISTNPSSSPVLTLASSGNVGPADVLQSSALYENRNIWLNGVSVEIVQENYNPNTFGPNAVLVQVRLDNYDVSGDLRWCGPIQVSPNEFDPTPNDFSDNFYAINMLPNSTVTLDRGRSYTEVLAVDQIPVTNENRFTHPTVMTLRPGSYFHMEDFSKLIVDGESLLDVKDGSRLEIHANSVLTVKNGSTLNLELGSQLVLHDNALVKIESGGKLLYNGGEIILDGDNSIIDFEGFLELAPNSEFTFTGNGFIKFSQQGWINPSTNPSNLIAGVGSKITLNGNGVNDKVLEVTQESLYAFLPLAKFTIIAGKVELGSDSRICVDGDLNLTQAKVTSTTGAFISHRGIQIFGQPNVVISSSIFEYGLQGIYAALFYGGTPLTINNSTFRFNSNGLTTIGRGVTLNNCRFTENSEIGWNAVGMSFPSVANSLQADKNFVGLSYISTGTSSLYLKNPSIAFNDWTGIEYDGPSTLTTYCGAVSSNATLSGRYGIYLANNSILNNSSVYSPLGGRTNMSGNYTAVYADCANDWYLIGGRNNFQSIDKLAKGKFNKPCNGSISGLNNRWKSTLSAPISLTDYMLDGCASSCIPNDQIIISDANPKPTIACGLIWNKSNSEIQALKNANPITHAPGAEKITTLNFTNVKLNEAVELAMSYLEFGTEDLATGLENDLTAVSLFSQILSYDYNQGNKFNNSTTIEEEWLLELSNMKLKEALANAIKNNKTEAELSSPYVTMTLNALSAVCQREIGRGNFEKACYSYIDVASVYKLVNEHEKALSKLNELTSCIPLDSIQLRLIESLKKDIYAENQLLTNVISKAEFYGSWVEINSSTYIIASQNPITNSPNDSLFANAFTVGENINFSLPDFGTTVTWDFGDCESAIGGNVSHAYAKPGIYTVHTEQTICNTEVFEFVITILPEMSLDHEIQIVSESCSEKGFDILPILNVAGIDVPSCTSQIYTPLDYSNLRVKLHWDSDKPGLQDFDETYTLNELIDETNSAALFTLLKGTTGNLTISGSLEYFQDSNWWNTTNSFSTIIEIENEDRFEVIISFGDSICPKDSVNFYSNIIGGTGPYQYEWSIDHSEFSDPNPVTLFNLAGTYVVSIEVTDANGCNAIVSFPQGESHTHFNLPDSTIEHRDEYEIHINECPTIDGYLIRDNTCSNISTSNVIVELYSKTSGQRIATTTDASGRFYFSATEVSNLNPLSQFILSVNYPKDIFAINPAIGLVNDLINQSPIELIISKVRLEDVQRKSIVEFHSDHYNVVSDPSGNIYEISTVSTFGSADYQIVKYDPFSALIWSTIIDNNSAIDSVKSITLDSINNVYVTGTSTLNINEDYFTVKLDSEGNYIWSVLYQDSLNTKDVATHICVQSNGDICVAGSNEYNGVLFYSNIKYNECHETPQNSAMIISNDPTVTNEDEKIIVSTVRVYPNPNDGNLVYVNGTFLEESRFELYAMNGELIQSTPLLDGTTPINLKKVAAGSYYYVIKTVLSNQEINRSKILILE